MALESTIADIGAKLRAGRFSNEQSVSQGIVLRVLRELKWNTDDTLVVWPEYATGGGRADFALCEPPSKPQVLIEVKQLGKAESGVKQSLEYAFHTGVPFVVLTDGRTWSFYLPAESGDYEDRRVFKLDLFEHASDRSAEILRRYLDWRGVASGEALEGARNEYRSQARRSTAREAIPGAWRRLVEQPDELLVDLVGDAVESKEGVRPEDVDVARFLAGLGKGAPIRSITRPAAAPGGHRRATIRRPIGDAPAKPSANRSSTSHQKGAVVVFGEEFSYGNAKERMMIVLRELANNDPTFLNRCYQHSKFSGRKRRYISRNIEEIYPDKPDLRESSIERLPDGWWVGTNLNNRQKEALVRAAVEVAGLRLGTDIVI